MKNNVQYVLSKLIENDETHAVWCHPNYGTASASTPVYAYGVEFTPADAHRYFEGRDRWVRCENGNYYNKTLKVFATVINSRKYTGLEIKKSSY